MDYIAIYTDAGSVDEYIDRVKLTAFEPPLQLSEIEQLFPAIQIEILILIDHCIRTDERDCDRLNRKIILLAEIDKNLSRDLAAELLPFEHLLRSDPVGAYSQSDRYTKATYRAAVRQLSEAYCRSDSHVTATALELARSSIIHTQAPGSAMQHIGYYLVDIGLYELEDRLVPATKKHLLIPQQRFRHQSVILFHAAMASLMALIGTTFIYFTYQSSELSFRYFISLMAMFVASSDSAMTSLTYLLILRGSPRPLFRLDYSNGIPYQFAPLVAVSCLLIDEEQVEALVTSLEDNYSRAAERHVAFALLTDYLDSDSKQASDMENRLLQECMRRIDVLNSKYRLEHDVFFLLHRDRTFSPTQGQFIGAERKYGKLHSLNRYLEYGLNEFSVTCGDIEYLRKYKTVLALDDDTKLTPNAIQLLAGTLAHPLNQPIIDVGRTVTRGYGVIQPNMLSTRASASRWKCSEAIFGMTEPQGPLPRLMISPFQDAFGKFFYQGKALYDVHTFNAVVDHHIPKESLLSHDIVEGGFVKAALVSDAVLVEEFPSDYLSLSRRSHRWMSGDWQNTPWLLAFGRKNIGAFTRFGILNQLRRCLVPIAWTIFLLSSFFVDGNQARAAVTFLLAMYLIPGYLFCCILMIVVILQRSFEVGYRENFVRSFRQICGILIAIHLNATYYIITTLHQALLSFDATFRSIYRLSSRKNLLQWVSTAYLMRNAKWSNVASIYLYLSAAGSAVLLATQVFYRSVPAIAYPVLALWSSCPWFVSWLARGGHQLPEKGEFDPKTSSSP